MDLLAIILEAEKMLPHLVWQEIQQQGAPMWAGIHQGSYRDRFDISYYKVKVCCIYQKTQIIRRIVVLVDLPIAAVSTINTYEPTITTDKNISEVSKMA